jgi:serine/threonine protein kinase
VDVSRSDFKGTRRFRIVRRIGTGGMGEVYEAFDRAHQTRVALKLLTVRKPDALLRFKNEFRALRDLEHPNLVSFGELVEDAGSWFFTMEFVDGVDFYEYVRPGDESELRPTRRIARGTHVGLEPGRGNRVVTGFDEARLRHALGQLVDGVPALHAAGKIHRDIKPSNIRVTRGGRVVLLDFGLVTDIERTSHLTGVEEMVGTPAFASPEQAAMREVGPEADWYAVGVVLYLALTRHLPFDGAAADILHRKQEEDPPPPSSLVPAVPPDLEVLCCRLLHRDPEARPSAAEILRRAAGVTKTPTEPVAVPAPAPPLPPFVGRSAELATLSALLDETRDDRAITCYLHGESGVGKTALLRQFADAAAASRGAVVLTARCYENEQVPFKAVDGLIDALIGYLRELPRREVAAILPAKVSLLTQVFPALRGVEAIADAPLPPDNVRDPQELRSRAFTAVRELLARLGERRPLVLVLDDMQWSDADSLALLREIMRVPEPPALLLVLVVRDTTGSEVPALVDATMPGAVVHVDLGRLGRAEAVELAAHILEQVRCGASALAEAIADEAAGHPLFIDELARHAGASEVLPGTLILDEVLWSRIESLGSEARQILEVVALAGEPLPRRIVAQAVAMDGVEFARRATLLRVGHLLRQSDTGHQDSLEPYHDRVRTAVLARLDAESRAMIHRRLAGALEAARTGDLETLAWHWRGAGDTGRAVRYALRAAAQASAGLAFERSAQLYRFALELGIADAAEARRTRVHRADALRNAGLGSDAAAAYLEAAATSACAAERLEMQRRAAEELLLSGHFDDGMAVLSAVLSAIGTRLPATPRRALASLLWSRLRLRLRGLGFRERDASQIAAEELSRADVSWSVAAGLAIIDNVRSADFQCRNLLEALRNGEPRRIARALAIEAGHSAIGASTSERRTRRLLDASAELAIRLGDPYALGLQTVVSAMAALLGGRWRDGRRLCDEGDALLRSRCTGVAWEIDTAQMFAMDCLWFLGELRELARRLPLRVAEAQARGDLYASINFRTGAPCLVWVAADEAELARRHVADAMARWSRSGVHLQHYRECYSLMNVDLYEGAGAAALRRADEIWPRLAEAQLFRVHLVRNVMHDLRGRAAVAAAMSGDRTLLARALADARALERGTMPWGLAAASAIRAGAAAVRGDREQALTELRVAVPGFAMVDMPLYAAAAQRRLGALLGGAEGKGLVATADARLIGEGVVRPDRFTAMLLPGFDGVAATQ